MADKNNKELKHSDIHISELNDYNQRKARFTVQSNNTKPYDISKMTGNSSNTNNKEG